MFWQITWKDEYKIWNPADYNGIKNVSLDPSTAWRPILDVWNTKVTSEPIAYDSFTYIIVFNNGLITWYPMAQLATSCSVDVTYFPFDKQVGHKRYISCAYWIWHLL